MAISHQPRPSGSLPAGLEDPRDIILGSLQDQSAAVGRGYMGSLADREARAMVSISFLISRDELSAITRVVGSPRTLYESNSSFYRHAVFELLQAYEEQGLGDTLVKDIIEHARIVREGAELQRLRQNFAESIGIYETSLTHGIDASDWDLLADTLATMRSFIERTEDRYWRGFLQRMILKSPVVLRAIECLYEGCREQVDMVPLFQEGERWQTIAEVALP